MALKFCLNSFILFSRDPNRVSSSESPEICWAVEMVLSTVISAVVWVMPGFLLNPLEVMFVIFSVVSLLVAELSTVSTCEPSVVPPLKVTLE